MIEPQTSPRPAIEPVLPLINIVFLLLIFFMVAGHFSAPVADIELPEDHATDIDKQPQVVDAVLYPGAELLLAGSRYQLHQADVLPEAQDAQPLHLYADKTLTGEELRLGLKALNDAGFSQILLISKGAPGSSNGGTSDE